MTRANGHQQPRRRLPAHLVSYAPDEPTPWYEREAVLVLGSTLALALTLFAHLLTEELAATVAPVFLRPLLHLIALSIGVVCMRGAGNTMRTAGSVTASNGRLVVAAFAGFAVIFASAFGLFSILAALDHLLG